MILKCAESARRKPGRAGARVPGKRSDAFAHPPGIEHGQRQRRKNAPERRFFRRLSDGAPQLALGLDFRLEKPLPRNPQRLGHVDQLVSVCHYSSRKGTAPPAGGFAVGDDARKGADEKPHSSDQSSIVFADQVLQAGAVTPAPCQPRPISQQNQVGPVDSRLDLPDTVGVDDRRLVDPQETRTVQASLQIAQGLADQMPLLPSMNPGVIAFGPDPIDLLGWQEKHPAARADDEAFGGNARRANTLEEREEPSAPGGRRSEGDLRAGPT